MHNLIFFSLIDILRTKKNIYFTAELWGCPNGYKMFLGRCYKFFQEGKTWVDAHIDCKMQGRNGQIARPQYFAEVFINT